eukprot:scaffold2826_cov55-Phaeocystis_antarctica.AAC.3
MAVCASVVRGAHGCQVPASSVTFNHKEGVAVIIVVAPAAVEEGELNHTVKHAGAENHCLQHHLAVPLPEQVVSRLRKVLARQVVQRPVPHVLDAAVALAPALCRRRAVAHLTLLLVRPALPVVDLARLGAIGNLAVAAVLGSLAVFGAPRTEAPLRLVGLGMRAVECEHHATQARGAAALAGQAQQLRQALRHSFTRILIKRDLLDGIGQEIEACDDRGVLRVCPFDLERELERAARDEREAKHVARTSAAALQADGEEVDDLQHPRGARHPRSNDGCGTSRAPRGSPAARARRPRTSAASARAASSCQRACSRCAARPPWAPRCPLAPGQG